jgi:hypothetical protein
MANLEALSLALPKAYRERGEWILKQQEIAETSHSKILKEQLLISNRVLATCGTKLPQYLKEQGAITERFGNAFTKLAGQNSQTVSQALEHAKKSSPGMEKLVLQNAKLQMDANEALFKLFATVQDGLNLIHEQNVASLVVLFQLDASPQRQAFFEELRKGVTDKFLGLIPGVDLILIAYRSVEAAVLARIRQGESASEFLASIEKFNDGGLHWLSAIDAHVEGLKNFDPFAQL